jgi:probable rRNA maturation factor
VSETTAHSVTVQREALGWWLPADDAVENWVSEAIGGELRGGEMTVRFVGAEEGASLNETYRGKASATNVLSFAADVPEIPDLAVLGDLVVCAPVVEAEAQAQDKALTAHYAHMVVHGTLHLLGFDHETNADAEQMEGLECAILSRLGFPNPYEPAR